MVPRSSLVALGALVAIIAISGAATAERVYFDHGELDIPLAHNEDAPNTTALDYDCETYDGCPGDLKGYSYHDHHVGPAIDSANPDENDTAGYVMDPQGPFPALESWQVCGFDDAGEQLFCHEQSHGWMWMLGYMPVETEHLRIILRPFAPSNYYLDIYV